MLVEVNVAITLDVEFKVSAEMFAQKWINKLIDNKDIIEGEVLFSEEIPEEEFDIPEDEDDNNYSFFADDDNDYSFKGFPNYPGHPL